MENNNKRIKELLEKLETLQKKQYVFSKELKELRNEIYVLQSSESSTEFISKVETTATSSELDAAEFVPEQPDRPRSPSVKSKPQPVRKRIQLPELSKGFEKFIGENLINKIGIIMTIIGVAIGAKYSIDNNLISPLTRIIFGYLSGIVLLGFGIKLKPKYEAYSAVLVSGAIAILYFITFAAYSFYGLIPQLVAFGLMVLFTAFTVFAAIQYDRQVIAFIGLVGAYAVPFLLSSGSGDMVTLFSYIAIINVGILFIAFKKYWKPVYYAAFILTWMMFLPWFAFSFKQEELGMAMTFGFIFFAIFYLTFLGYKLLQKEKLSISDTVLLLLNSFIFYGIGYVALQDHTTGKHLLGLFTLGNALIHFIVGVVLYRQKLGNRNLFYLVALLVLTFITIAIPVELDGNWVTLLWVTEAALLFSVGRIRSIPVYEYVAYPLMILAVGSLYEDWQHSYYFRTFGENVTFLKPLLNVQFLTSALFIGAFAYINYLFFNKKYSDPLAQKWDIQKIISYALPITLVGLVYLAFKGEIECYWNQLYHDSMLQVPIENSDRFRTQRNYELPRFKNIWVINYTLLFLSLLSFLNLKRLKNNKLGIANLVLNITVIIAFLAAGLFELDGLRRSYLNQNLAEFYPQGRFYIGIRYVSYVFVALLLWVSSRYTRSSFMKRKLTIPFDLVFHFTILAIASNELINLMQVFNSDQSYKLGLSILWGLYASVLIGLGFWKKKKHLRMAAFALFAITLLKVIFYDLAHLDTISKTIVFVLLGVLLLLISFFYNKYKHLIFEEE